MTNIDLAKLRGKELQTTVAMEECAELIQAISKLKRYGENLSRRFDLIEEMVDVEICIEQLKYFFNVSETEMDAIRDYKIKREEERENGSTKCV